MSNILYKVVDRKIHFRRHESSVPYLSDWLPNALRQPVEVPEGADPHEWAKAIVLRSGWVGRSYDVDTYPGKAFLGSRDFTV